MNIVWYPTIRFGDNVIDFLSNGKNGIVKSQEINFVSPAITTPT